MNKINVAGIFKQVKTLAIEHSPEILTGIGIAGLLTTTVLAVKATPKALQLIEAKKEELGVDKLTPVETVKAAWKPYVPAVVTGVLGTACVIGANSVSLRRNAALATAYKLSETALAEYKEKAVEVVGEKKEQAIREKIAEERIKENPVSKNEVFITGKGETLFLEPLSKRYFKSDIDHIRRVENRLNKQMLHDITGYVSLSEFYDELGLDRTAISDDIGWNTNDLIDIEFHAAITDDEKPCLALDYQVNPKYDYWKIM
jgi:hypothetical protein